MEKEREQFESPYDQYKDHVGKRFKVLGKVESASIDEEVMEPYTNSGHYPLYYIELATGEKIKAWHEEIYL